MYTNDNVNTMKMLLHSDIFTNSKAAFAAQRKQYARYKKCHYYIQSNECWKCATFYCLWQSRAHF